MNHPTQPTQPQALAGLRVLDFSRVLAGPLCTMTLADMGAEVVKIEHPRLGDETRHWGPPWVGSADDKMSAYYLSINRNKASVALDLKTVEGLATARQLALKADVLIENFKVGQMAKFGLDYASLAEDNPGLVYCSLTGYGQTGPYAERAGYDYVIQAQTGLMSITGSADGEPQKVGVAISDVITGLTATNAIQSALLYRERTGHGQYLDVALFDSQLAALVNIASNHLVSGQIPQRLGNIHANIVPYQVFSAQDGDFVLAVGNDRQFVALCGIIGKNEWVTDERMATNGVRVENRELVVSLLSEILSTQPVAYWIEHCLAQNIPCGKINTVAEALNLDQTQARQMVQSVTLSNGETVQLVAPPVKFSATPATIRTPPPALGQDTTDVLERWLNKAN